MGSSGSVNYVFERVHSGSHPSCPSGYRMVTMSLYSSPPDPEGKPANFNPEQLESLGVVGRNVCGPCGSLERARAVVRQRCPNPMTTTNELMRQMNRR
jgi:hypothetical protein